jgi:hypothetical protein
MRRLACDFSDLAGQEVLAVAVPEQTLTDEDRLFDCLLENGTPVERVEGAVAAIDALIDELAIRRAAECLRRLLDRLPESTVGGAALRRLALGETESLRHSARKAGVTHRALAKAVATIRRRLGIHPPPIVRGETAPD